MSLDCFEVVEILQRAFNFWLIILSCLMSYLFHRYYNAKMQFECFERIKGTDSAVYWFVFACWTKGGARAVSDSGSHMSFIFLSSVVLGSSIFAGWWAYLKTRLCLSGLEVCPGFHLAKNSRSCHSDKACTKRGGLYLTQMAEIWAEAWNSSTNLIFKCSYNLLTFIV